MKDILIIAQYISTHSEQGNSRFTYIADLLAEEGNNVEIVTTSFSHATKQYRDIVKDTKTAKKYKLTMLDEPGYKKNVCIKRLYSHFILSKNLAKYLKKISPPDIIYCAVPSLDFANEASKYAKKNNISFIIDVQDLWPEAFKMVFNVPILSNMIFKPMEIRANNIYKKADEIVAVSETYVKRALNVNSKVKSGLSVFLGTDLENYNIFYTQNKIYKPKNEIWIGYIGTLGNSYDIPCIIDALENMNKDIKKKIKFLIIGDGPLKRAYEKYAQGKMLNIQFIGRLAYHEMVGWLGRCDIAVNPIKVGSAASIVNKVCDYAGAGLPVINTQMCKEYQDIIERYRCGINCDSKNINTITAAITMLIEDKNLRTEMGENSRRVAEEMFDRRHTYKKIVTLIGEGGRA